MRMPKSAIICVFVGQALVCAVWVAILSFDRRGGGLRLIVPVVALKVGCVY